jgi:hypothetical protein
VSENGSPAAGGGVAEVTLKGATRATKGRRRGGDVFSVVLAAPGVEIRRPGEPVRTMPWEGITEWEIERRRGGVRLFLRGGGAVTRIVVPGWNADELGAALLAATSSPAPEPEPERTNEQ